MGTTLASAQQAELAATLTHVAVVDDGFIPDPAYRPIHKLVPWPAVEVIIYDTEGRFVLTHRDDDFTGWHIPGGFIKVNETFQTACDRNVRKEQVAESVSDLRLIASHTWLKGEHPFGFPISLTFACRAVGTITERADLRWFHKIPDDIIAQQHPKFLAHFLEWLKDPNMPSAAIIL